MKSPTPTVLFGFGEQRIRKSQFVFFHVKILHLKKEKRATTRSRETEKTVVLFHHASPPTPGLFRIESFPKVR
jgi:hypothetical protein